MGDGSVKERRSAEFLLDWLTKYRVAGTFTLKHCICVDPGWNIWECVIEYIRIYFGQKLGSIKLLSSFQRPIHHYLLWPLTSRVPALVGRLTGITTSVAAILSHQLHFRKQATQKHFKILGTWNRFKSDQIRCVTSHLKTFHLRFPPRSHHQIPRLFSVHEV